MEVSRHHLVNVGDRGRIPLSHTNVSCICHFGRQLIDKAEIEMPLIGQEERLNE